MWNLGFDSVEFGILCDSVSILGSSSVLGLGGFLDVWAFCSWFRSDLSWLAS